MQACLLFATELYALPILRPLEAAARARGIRTAWVVSDELAGRLRPGEQRLTRRQDVHAFGAQAVYSAANWVPPEFPGIKVQVFHGFNAEKREPDRGHFNLRGFFDLYCTQGPATTAPFQALAREHAYFGVSETGWPKLDPLFDERVAGAVPRPDDGRPVVMYAATFSKALSSAPAMLETLRALIARGDRQWLLTLHPKCEPALVEAYRALQGSNARYYDAEQLIDMQRAADVLVSDTSSVIHEFAVQLKPVVTLRNRRPKPFMLDVQQPEQVDAAIDRALGRPAELMDAVRAHAQAIHPYRDGRSSERLLDVTDRFLAGDFGRMHRKPLNLLRRWKAQRELGGLIAAG